MSFGQFKSYFLHYFEKANVYGLGWLFVIFIVGLLIWYLSKGNKLSFRVPFLPRFMNKVTLDPKALEKFKRKGDAQLSENPGEMQGGSPEGNQASNSVSNPASKEALAYEQRLQDTPEVNATQSDRTNSLWRLLVGANEKRYGQPTYLVLSHEESQYNQAMLNHLKPMLANKVIKVSKGLGQTADNWYHFDDGTLILAQNVAQAITQAQQYRPERPLDGMIVTLSVKKLMQTRLSDDILDWANQIFKQIWETQKQTGFVLPIYLLLTETETLPSFAAYWDQPALAERLSEPFGWVNCHSSSHIFQAAWIEEAVGELSRYLRNIQIGIMSENGNKTYAETANALLFPEEVETLSGNLTRFCAELFRHTIFQTPLILRGIHFSGVKAPMHGHQPPRHLFVKEWLERVVYPESELGYAPRNRFISSNQTLRRYQYATVTVFTLLSLLLIRDAVDLSRQADNLDFSIREFPQKPYVGPAQLDYVNQVVEHLAKMDAGKINYPTMPFSWHTPFNDKLVTYFDTKAFDNILFPAMQCRMQSQLQERLSQNTQPLDAMNYKQWLAALTNNVEQEKALHEYIERPLDKGMVIDRFGEFYQYLWGKELPKSFYKNTDLYAKAIAKPTTVPPYDCAKNPVSKEETWHKVKDSIEGEMAKMSQRVTAPQAFFKLSQQMQSLPAGINWGYKTPAFAKELSHFNQWLSNLNHYWLLDHPQINECEYIRTELTHLVQAGLNEGRKYLNHFFDMCVNNVSQTLVHDDTLAPFTLYETKQYPFSFSGDAQNRFKEIQALNTLDFMTMPLNKKQDMATGDFYWSTERLNRALALEEEYETFALKQYNRLWLPEKASNTEPGKYFAQGIALKQLQNAMFHHIVHAQTQTPIDYHPEHLRPINQLEADLAASVANFEKSMDSIMSLLLTFKKLEFTESYNWFRDLTQRQAYKLLQRVDKVYRDSRVYRPLNKPRWSAHQYNNVLFGIGGEGQLNDYISAQNERANEIALNYAEPLIVFLLNTKGKYLDYDLFGKWQNTLIEINKQQSKNPANSLDNLENFLRGQLASVDQSNCFKTVKDLVSPGGNDVFAIQQRAIKDKAVNHCEQFRADKIKGEYAKVRSLFDRYLAGYAPFNQMPDAKSVSPKAMRQFLQAYLPIANGLIDRMEVLAWKDGRNKKAEQFIREMNDIAAFFSAVLIAPKGESAPGLALKFDFNVLESQAKYVRHLTQWQWQVGNERVSYPGTEKSLVWMPNQPVKLSLHWAEQSPFVPTPHYLQVGASRAHVNAGGSHASQGLLSYHYQNVWSLLDFVSQHRSALPDPSALAKHSVLLAFKAGVRSKDANAPQLMQQEMHAFARLTAFGLETKVVEQDDGSLSFVPGEKIEIAIPSHFPQSVPKVH